MSFNVLVVDDSVSMRAVIKKIILVSGFNADKILEASNGKEALDVLGREWVDMIISDINMPEMNGLELLSMLKQNSLYAELPIIMISTEGSEERIQEAFALGARGFIKKPFLPEELREKLYETIGVNHHGEYGQDREDSSELDF
jgi:two-component system, chemotaxis family, chemotaxis protein CheY